MDIKKTLNISVILIILALFIFSAECTTRDDNDRPSTGTGTPAVNVTETEKTNDHSELQNPFISINPVIWSQEDQILNVTGTTNFPSGSEITISSGMLVHPCPTSPTGSKPDTSDIRTFCNGKCSNEIVKYHVYADPNPGGNNTWSCLVNTSGWCIIESYFIRAGIDTEKETIQDTKVFRFSG